jgi:hypothetical protein
MTNGNAFLIDPNDLVEAEAVYGSGVSGPKCEAVVVQWVGARDPRFANVSR